MKKAPIVNINTNEAIKSLVGDYTEETQDLIHDIAKNQDKLLVGCCTMADLEENVKAYIEYREACIVKGVAV